LVVFDIFLDVNRFVHVNMSTGVQTAKQADFPEAGLFDKCVEILVASDDDIFIFSLTGNVIRWCPSTDTEVQIFQLGEVKFRSFESEPSSR
jgi:hypothetical protein